MSQVTAILAEVQYNSSVVLLFVEHPVRFSGVHLFLCKVDQLLRNRQIFLETLIDSFFLLSGH